MNEIQKYFKYRQGLIDQYQKGDMTKREYLQANYEAVSGNYFKPFRNADTVEKALYNYQYYNALAKQMKFISTETGMDVELKKEYQQRSSDYYRKKDRATLKALQLLDYQDVSAYYIKTKSRSLNGRLIEIVLPVYDMILHTASGEVLERLKEELIFYDETRTSLIDDYVNQKY